jgi:hypothetical protein
MIPKTDNAMAIRTKNNKKYKVITGSQTLPS